MHIIPHLILEAILGTKQPSEKTRKVAFELVVAMGRKMNEGGVVKRSLLGVTDQEGETEGMFLDRSQHSHLIIPLCSQRQRGGVHDHGRKWSDKHNPVCG